MRIFGKKRNFDLGWAVVLLMLIGLGTYVAWDQGFLTGPLQPVGDWWDEQINPDTDITSGTDMVTPKIVVKESLGARSDEDIITNVYSADGTWLGTATASSGVATYSSIQVQEGSYIYIQGRQAAPASADGYVTPLTEFRVGNGDSGDTVIAYNTKTGQGILFVDNLHDSTEPVFTFRAPDGADLSGGSVDNLTTNDEYIQFNIYIADDDCWYGAPDFTDQETGNVYKGGIWVVVRHTNDYTYEQGSAREMLSWSTVSYMYTAFNFDIRLWQDSVKTGDENTFTAQLRLADGADFDQGSETLSFDVFDMYKVSSSVSLSNFVDGGALAPVAVTGYVD